MTYTLSVIIPFRCETASTAHLLSRLQDLCTQLNASKQVEFIVVDSGSSSEYQTQCKNICKSNNIKYLYHNTLGQAFSIGACRDFGVQHAQGKAVTFLDVDLRVPTDFWDRLLVLMETWGMGKYKKSFLAIPCLYLTQDGTEEFINTESDHKFTDFYLRYLQGDKQAIENLAYCSSVMVVDRNHYLAIGGHDLAFRGHGYEDFELYHRLLCEENIIPKTEDYYLDQKIWNTATYKGFRSHLAIAARPALLMNLFVVHLWHPRPKDASFYNPKSLQANRNIWQDKFKEFVATGIHPEALPTAENQHKNIVFFGKAGTAAANCIQNAVPHLGKIIYISELNFMDSQEQFLADDFANFLKEYNVSAILFPNPYGNAARLAIYQWCKTTKFPYYVYERGALPDSWFFDTDGFNADSSSYQETHWQKVLDETQQLYTQNYIHECINGANTLEKQSDRIGAGALAHKLQLGNKKVLFVPMQRPSDTVMRYMIDNAQSFDYFMQTIDRLAEKLKSKGWVVLCKKHPLETEAPTLQHAQYVPQDTHFIDLLELADRVALVNSGVGVYAMMMNKPCYIFGKAFYTIDGVNQTVEFIDNESDAQLNELAKKITAGFTINSEKMYRFIHYLISEFYSFGTPKTRTRQEKDGSLRTITTNIDFYCLRLNGKTIFEYSAHNRPALSLTAPLFERYALDIHMQSKAKNEAAKPKPPAPKPAPKPAPAPKPTPKPASAPIIGNYEKSKTEIRQAKMSKLWNNPHQFFADAKNPILQSMKHLFKR